MGDNTENYSRKLFVQHLIGFKSVTVYYVLACTAFFFFHDGLFRLLWRKKVSSKKFVFFLVDYFLIILPTLFIITVLSDWLPYLLRFLIISSAVLMLKCAITSDDREDEANTAAIDGKGFSQEHIVVTEFRGCVLLLVCIAILAVDFDLFPWEMMKSDRQGYSVMDLGVGTFIIANALVAPQTKETHKSSWKLMLSDVGDTVVLLILGVSRYVSAYITGYHVSESEYGKHWNFFCTLAFVKIFGRLLAALLHPVILPYIGLLIGCLYEIVLQFGLHGFVLDSSSSQTYDSTVIQFLFDNRSGLSSSIGFLAMFLMWLDVGRLFRAERRTANDLIQLIRHLLKRSFFLFIITYAMRVPSRRLANLSYIFWISYQVPAFLAFQLMARLTMLYIDQNSIRLAMEFKTRGGDLKALSHFQRKDLGEALSTVDLASPRASHFTSTILSAMNYNAMVFFLLANLLTGLVNLSTDTRQYRTFGSMLVLTTYLTVITSVAYLLYVKTIRVPLKLSLLRPTVLIKVFLVLSFLVILLFCLMFLKVKYL